MKRRFLMWSLWPSFLFASLGSAIVFALVDPLDIMIFGRLEVGRQMTYAAGFFLAWAMAALSSALSLYLASSSVIHETDDF